jgi:hypothetical protein
MTNATVPIPGRMQKEFINAPSQIPDAGFHGITLIIGLNSFYAIKISKVEWNINYHEAVRYRGSNAS